ncbi:MAG: hypothetical protein J0L52_08625 [Caulobacterales bacterium]|nr:hypothetical protein [Caulobacterales bacterium]
MSEPDDAFEAEVAGYRQPMVTSIGIVMGFLLAFMANWAVTDTEERALQDPVDWLVAGTLMVSITLMVVVLVRLLDNRIRAEGAGRRYQLTFRLYIAAISAGLLGLAAALVI